MSYLTLKNIVILKSRIGSVTLRITVYFAEIYRPGTIFPAVSMGIFTHFYAVSPRKSYIE